MTLCFHLIESSQISVVFCCLDITLSEVEAGEVEGEEVELLWLVEQDLVLTVTSVDGDLLKDEGQHPLAGGKEQVVSGQMFGHDGQRFLRVPLGVAEFT